MIRTRSARALASLGLITTLALTAMAGPATVLGAQAQADFSSIAVLDEVSPTGFIAYDVSFDLAAGETSNLSQLYLTAATPRAGTPSAWDLIGVEAGSESRPGTCVTTGINLACTFGSMAPADPAITLRVVYQVGTATGNESVHFLFNTTGVAGDPKKNSHGDSYDAFDQILVESSDHLAASYVQAAGVVVADVQTLSRQNPQATKVTAPVANIPVIAGEESGLTQCTAVLGSACFGQGSLIKAGPIGATFPAGFKVEISYNANKPNASFLHFFDPETVGVGDPAYEDITTTCDANHSVMPCKTIVTTQGQTFATIWLIENGKLFGH